jgi:hypothetical protein
VRGDHDKFKERAAEFRRQADICFAMAQRISLKEDKNDGSGRTLAARQQVIDFHKIARNQQFRVVAVKLGKAKAKEPTRS